MTTFSLLFLFGSVVIASAWALVRHLRKRRGNPFPRVTTDHDKERSLLRETMKGMQ
jgi:hypothetical protein